MQSFGLRALDHPEEPRSTTAVACSKDTIVMGISVKHLKEVENHCRQAEPWFQRVPGTIRDVLVRLIVCPQARGDATATACPAAVLVVSRVVNCGPRGHCHGGRAHRGFAGKLRCNARCTRCRRVCHNQRRGAADEAQGPYQTSGDCVGVHCSATASLTIARRGPRQAR
jgi:hypothetical protein